MAKKVRRVKKKRPQRVEDVVKEEVQVEKSEAAVNNVSVKRQSTSEEFQAEYGYVLKDLRRVLILTAAMFALLIVLNLILQ